MDKLKLKWRLFAFLLGFSALLLLILWLFQTVFLNDMYKLIRKGEIENAIATVEKNINSSNLQTILYELEIDKEIVVMPKSEFEAPKRSKLDGKDKVRPESITRTKMFTFTDNTEIELTFHAMITPVDATLKTLKIQLYIITAIMILLSVLIAVIIAKHISKPIENINNAAKVLATGDYETKFTGKGFLEIQELASTLNIAANELSKVEGLRRELMANISHDLRTPLALIYSYAEMMHDFPDEVTSDQPQVIMDETQRLTSLVNDIVDVSRLEALSYTLCSKEYSLTSSLQNVVNRISNMTKKDGFTFDFKWDEDVFVYADEVKITQVFYNLLINAINYSCDDKHIIVRQIMMKGCVKIEVEDNGEGIDDESLPYIWERYYKADKTHKRAIAGSGLGLSIVKKIVKLHGGNCGVRSKKGEGSAFWFSLNAGSQDDII